MPAGQIVSPTSFGEDIEWYFAGPDPAIWFDRIGATLLSWAYPALPIRPSLFPRPLTAQDVTMVYEAIFTSNNEATPVLGEFGPGLGLSKSDAPFVFDPGNCQVFEQIRADLEGNNGELPWGQVHHRLAHAYGLTRSLASLYLFTFVRYGLPETELALVPGHLLEFGMAEWSGETG